MAATRVSRTATLILIAILPLIYSCEKSQTAAGGRLMTVINFKNTDADQNAVGPKAETWINSTCKPNSISDVTGFVQHIPGANMTVICRQRQGRAQIHIITDKIRNNNFSHAKDVIGNQEATILGWINIPHDSYDVMWFAVSNK